MKFHIIPDPYAPETFLRCVGCSVESGDDYVFRIGQADAHIRRHMNKDIEQDDTCYLCGALIEKCDCIWLI